MILQNQQDTDIRREFTSVPGPVLSLNVYQYSHDTSISNNYIYLRTVCLYIYDCRNKIHNNTFKIKQQYAVIFQETPTSIDCCIIVSPSKRTPSSFCPLGMKSERELFQLHNFTERM